VLIFLSRFLALFLLSSFLFFFSFSGKSTLMDCIAGRKTTGAMSAEIRLNGQIVDIHSAFFQQLCGYVEQVSAAQRSASERNVENGVSECYRAGSPVSERGTS
jgi:ABC-type phosphate/phosphonate transport system ATPase subunit